MKKIILFVVLATFGMSLNSCSSDDSSKKTEEPIEIPLNPVGTISFKVNGSTKTFNNFIMVDQQDRYHVTARIGTGIADILEFTISKGGATGTTGIYSFEYRKNNITYDTDENFTYFIETNSNRTIIISFNGGMSSFETGGDLTLTNGVINLTY